jgi:hypothetical protein
MSEQSIDKAAEAATTGDADPGESGQGATRAAEGQPVDAGGGGDGPVPDRDRRAQDAPAGADEDTSTEGEDVLRTTAERAGTED